jgi:hypothetical protein
MDDLFSLDSTQLGAASSVEVDGLAKALLAPESVDSMYETSGGVLTMQSLEGMLADLTLNEQDFTLWKDINKLKAFSTVEEYDQQLGHGLSDGGFVGQMENPEFRDPAFKKDIAIIRYMSEGWQVGDVEQATRKIIDSKTRVQRSAMMRLLRNLNMALYTGNDEMVPLSFNGLEKTISEQSADQVRDLRGAAISQSVFNLVSQLIEESNGNPDNAKIYSSPAGVKSIHDIISGSRDATINTMLMNSGDKNLTLGARTRSIETPFGTMQVRSDKLLGMCYENRVVPQYFDQSTASWVEGATSEKAPGTPSITLTAQTGTTGSKFTATGVRPSGAAYRYRVCAKNAYGRSKACNIVTLGGNVAAGGSIDIAITPNGSDAGSKVATCFEIYSEKVAGSGEFRYMTTVKAAAGGAVVIYADKNEYIPGCARMFVIDQTSAGESRVMGFSQLLPIHNTDLARTGRFMHGLINMYGVPKYYKPNVLVEIRNISVDQSVINKYNMV